MKQLVEINIDPPPSMIEQELWYKYDAIAQARFLKCVVTRYRIETANVLYQMNAIADELHKNYTKETSESLIDLLQEMIDYIREAKEEVNR